MFDEFAYILCSTQVLRLPAETETDRTDKRALAGSVWSNNHVQVRSKDEFSFLVSDKVGHGDSHE